MFWNGVSAAAVMAVALAGAADAQGVRIAPRAAVSPVAPDENSPVERIYALEQQNAALKAQLAQLQQQLNQLKTVQDQGFFADRFRIGALELKNKNVFDALPGQVSDLTNRFQTHTHGFTYYETSYVNKHTSDDPVSLITGNHPATGVTTPPQ
jgi:hypothetical protein